MKIGLIVAIEMDSIFAYYQDVRALEAPAGFKAYYVRRGEHDLYVLHTGMGISAASCGVQYLITRYGVELIANFGVVGGLSEDLKLQKVCVVDRVVHYKYDCSEFMDLAVGQVDGHDSVFLPTTPDLVEKALATVPDLKTATCCSGDKFVGTEAEKRSIRDAFEGDVCDMESAGIVLTCEVNRVPCLLLKAVSDGLANAARSFYEELEAASFQCLSVADAVIRSL